MIRKIIHIDEEKCNGCGLCAEACHEGAIDIVDGKAKLMRENFSLDCLQRGHFQSSGRSSNETPSCSAGSYTYPQIEQIYFPVPSPSTK